jgi:hypothetical protein
MVEEADKKKEKVEGEFVVNSKINLEVFGGLKRGAERGETLKDSMMSFYRAGYPKEEIENAARIFLEEKEKMKKVAGAMTTNPALKGKKLGMQKSGNQKASKYGKDKGILGDKTTLFLISILILLLLVLASVFLFKSEMVDFFNNMFG